MSLPSSLSADRPVIVAVSGGADSLCLLSKLHEAGLQLIVAHYDHQLRPDSGEDARFVAEIAAQMGLPFVLGEGDVAAYAQEHKQTTEEAARNLRYHFLFAQARQHDAQAVAVGHTADDQVETVLMHFLRGSGLSGLKGMTPRTILPLFDSEIPLIRPILSLRRADTEACCATHGLTPRNDPSNVSAAYFRNRLRHELIPALEQYNPRFRDVVVRTSLALQGDYALLHEQVTRAWAQIVNDERQHCVTYDLPKLMDTSSALCRNLLKLGMEKLRPGQHDLSFAALERAADFISAPDGAQRLDLGLGLLLFREADRLYLSEGERHLPVDAFPQMGEFPLEVKMPGQLILANGWVFNGHMLSTAPMPASADPFQVTLDADALGGSLMLRPRRAGDRFAPLGMDGHTMKLKDFFINVKLPARARARYPLLCVDDEIVWVPGYRPAHPFRITEETQQIVSFSLKKEQGR